MKIITKKVREGEETTVDTIAASAKNINIADGGAKPSEAITSNDAIPNVDVASAISSTPQDAQNVGTAETLSMPSTSEGNQTAPQGDITSTEKAEVINIADGPQDAPMAESEKKEELIMDSVKFKGKFIIYEGAPRFVLAETRDKVTVLFNASTGEKIDIKKSEIKEMYRTSKVKKVNEAEDEKSAEDKVEDKKEDKEKEAEKKEESKATKKMKEDDKKDDDETTDSTAMTEEDEEKKDDKKDDKAEDKKDDKKEESAKPKIYTLAEDQVINGKSLKKGTRFIQITEEDDPENTIKSSQVKDVAEEDEEKKPEEKDEKKEESKKVKEDKEDDDKMAALRAKKDGDEDKKDNKKEESKSTKKMKEDDQIIRLYNFYLGKYPKIEIASIISSELGLNLEMVMNYLRSKGVVLEESIIIKDKKYILAEDDEEKKDDDKSDKKDDKEKSDEKKESVKLSKTKKFMEEHIAREDTLVLIENGQKVIFDKGDKFYILKEMSPHDNTEPVSEYDQYADVAFLKLEMPFVKGLNEQKSKLINKNYLKEESLQSLIQRAESLLRDFEKVYPNDNRPRKAIEAAKNYLKDPSAANKKVAAADAYAAADADAAAYAAAAAHADAAAYAADAAAVAASAASAAYA